MARGNKDDYPVECHMRNGTVVNVPQWIFAMVVMAKQYVEQYGIIPKTITYKQGAIMYSMSEKFFREWAKSLGAVRHIRGKAVVIVEILDRALDYYK